MLSAFTADAQCPQLYDYYGVPSASPEWFSCSGSNFNLLIATPQSIGAFTVDWGDGTAVYNGASLAPPMSVPHTYPATVATYTITFTEIGTGCTVTGTLTIEQSSSASIQIPIGGLTQVCAPHPVDFVNSSTNVSPNTVFQWDFGDGSPIITMNSTNLGQTITHTYLQGTVDCETTVRLTAENSCNTLQGGASLATFNPIRIWDIDDASIAASATLLCWPDRTVTFANTTNRNCLQQGNIFQRYEYWNFGDYWGAGQDSIIDWTPWPPTFPRVIQYPGIGTYEVMLLDSNYCGVDTATIQITIVPPPQVTLTVDPDTICIGETMNFDQTTAGGANYFQWNFGAGAGFEWTGAGDQAHTYAQAGTFLVQYTASIQGATAGCADTAGVQVTVLPVPTADFLLDQDAACDSITVAITDQSISAVQYLWDFGDGTTNTSAAPPPHTYTTAGAYVLSLTVTNSLGCTDTHNHTVNVYAPPTVAIQIANLCLGQTALFTPVIGTDPGNPVTVWDWDLGDGTTSSDEFPMHQFAAAGPYVITLNVTTPYCGGSGTQWVNVQAPPQAAFTPSAVLACSPVDVDFTNNTTGATQFLWLFGDGQSDTAISPSHTYTNFGTADSIYTVTLIAGSAFGCSDTARVDITVAPPVVAGFTHNAQPGCAPMNVGFTNTSTGASSYLWDFDDGSTSTATDPQHVYVNNTLFLGMHTVTLTAYSAAGCESTMQQTIMVYPTPDFTFIAQPDNGCSPLSVTFPSLAGAVTYQWSFGDGTSGSGIAPTHTYFNSTLTDQTFNVTLIGQNAFGCTDTANAPIVVNPQPVAQFIPGVLTGCQPLTVPFQDLTIGADSVLWLFGDGQSLATIPGNTSHTYQHTSLSPMTFNATLIGSTPFGCTDTMMVPIQVYPAITASFMVIGDGCSPLTVNPVNNSSGANSYLWDMGDGNILAGATPTHTYVNTTAADQIRTITLTATSPWGCVSVFTQAVTIHPVPSAAFQATPFGQQFPNATVTLNNTSAPGNWTYAWGFGDSQSSTLQQPGTHTYATWGSYTITLVVTGGGCSDSATQVVTIDPPFPTASFLGQGEGCVPLTIAFTNTSLGGLSYQWNFGDGGTSTADNPTYVYNVAGVYTVSLTAFGIGGGVSTAIKVDSVVVHPRANAFFVLQPDHIIVPSQPVFTYNLSANASSYSWDFGDGTSSAAFNPIHYYTQAGTFDVSLIANNQWNCPDTFTVVGATTGEVSGDLEFPNAFTPNSSGPTDGVYDAMSYDNDHFFPKYEGVENYHLEVFNRWGELMFVSTDVRIGWDGWYKGVPAKQDVYVWKCQATFSDGRETTLKGDVTLLR
ncbi:MAG: PKD domain-containing protein [Flavobacteriales bacterium]|nr:PKD domain-containing protein [Flavobacteriales bacterium]